ncbi:unnamed protein product [Caretta caretta]
MRGCFHYDAPVSERGHGLNELQSLDSPSWCSLQLRIELSLSPPLGDEKAISIPWYRPALNLASTPEEFATMDLKQVEEFSRRFFRDVSRACTCTLHTACSDNYPEIKVVFHLLLPDFVSWGYRYYSEECSLRTYIE